MFGPLKLSFASSLLALVPVIACSSSSGGGGTSTPPGIYCDATSAAVPTCYGYSNLTPEQQTAVTDSCTESLMGRVAGSCPDDGQLGCCTSTTAGYQTTECYYAGTASSFEEGCKAANGTWSGGSSDGGSTGEGDGSGSSSGSSKDSGSCSKSETSCPKGCVDLANDPKNCGRCGHVCKSSGSATGTCKKSTCS